METAHPRGFLDEIDESIVVSETNVVYEVMLDDARYAVWAGWRGHSALGNYVELSFDTATADIAQIFEIQSGEVPHHLPHHRPPQLPRRHRSGSGKARQTPHSLRIVKLRDARGRDGGRQVRWSGPSRSPESNV